MCAAGSLIDIRHHFTTGASTVVKVLVWTVLIKDEQVGAFMQLPDLLPAIGRYHTTLQHSRGR